MDIPRLNSKLEEIRAELLQLGLWQQQPPHWVARYDAGSGTDFLAWLQFIYLPNRAQYRQPAGIADIAPQAVAAFGDLPKDRRLLQLLVELDALI
jgi:uncharacterized protein YqcC (DUF446 family)